MNINNIIRPINSTFDRHLLPVISNPFIVMIITSLIVVNFMSMYHNLPDSVQMGMVHPATAAISILLGTYVISGNYVLSVAFTAAFFLVNYLIKITVENFDSLPMLPQSNMDPGCTDVTVNDLLALFDGNRDELKKTMYLSKVPLNVTLNDRNAPYIATHLINFGKSVSKTCNMPHDLN